MIKKSFKRPQQKNKRRERKVSHDADKIYLDGVVVDTLPGTRFVVRIERSKNLEPLIIECNIKTMFKVRKIVILRGDTVTVELDPNADLSKGIIVNRL